MTRQEEVEAVLSSYGVRTHYQASRGATRRIPRYAVFGPEGQITEPCDHQTAKQALRGIMARKIIALFEGSGS